MPLSAPSASSNGGVPPVPQELLAQRRRNRLLYGGVFLALLVSALGVGFNPLQDTCFVVLQDVLSSQHIGWSEDRI